jgi:hypothetical protein
MPENLLSIVKTTHFTAHSDVIIISQFLTEIKVVTKETELNTIVCILGSL